MLLFKSSKKCNFAGRENEIFRNIIDVVSSSWILFHITRPLLTLEDQETSQTRVNMGFNQTQLNKDAEMGTKKGRKEQKRRGCKLRIQEKMSHSKRTKSERVHPDKGYIFQTNKLFFSLLSEFPTRVKKYGQSYETISDHVDIPSCFTCIVINPPLTHRGRTEYHGQNKRKTDDLGNNSIAPNAFVFRDIYLQFSYY